MARRILDYRAANGPFKSIEDIQRVTGIGDATYQKLKDRITVGN
jgi:competence protein ComEA